MALKEDSNGPRGRVILLPFRVHPNVKQRLLKIKERDAIPSMPVMLELMMEAYEEKYSPRTSEARNHDK